jgi:hypothetical protein
LDQAGDAISDVRRRLRERADGEAARALTREQRRSHLRSFVRPGTTAFRAFVDASLVPFVIAPALRLRRQAGDAIGHMRRQSNLRASGRDGAAALRTYVARSLVPFAAALALRLGRLINRIARELWLASIVLVRHAARRSSAFVASKVGHYRERRSASRAAHDQEDPAVATPIPPTPADAPIDREKLDEELERRQLAVREEALGPEHPDVGLLTYIIAARCAARGEYDEARMFYERTGRIFEKAFGPDHPEVTAVLNDLAELHAAEGRTDDAAWCTTWAAELTNRRRTRLQNAAEADADTEVAEAATRG